MDHNPNNWRGTFTNMLSNTDPENQENSENPPNFQPYPYQPIFGYANMHSPNFGTPPMPMYHGFIPHPIGYGMPNNYSPGSSTGKTRGMSIPEDNMSGSEQQPGTPITSISDSPVPPFSTQECLENIIVNDDGAKRERWSIFEDKTLAKAWVTISTDPSVGNGQTGGTFWKRVTVYFNKYNPDKSKRTLEQLKSRYHRTQTDINEFNGIYNRINNEYRSGWSDDQKKQAAREEWKNLKTRHFTLEHMWEITKDFMKWNSAREDDDKSVKSAGSKRSSSNADEEAETRPMGTKAAKARKKGKNKGKKHGEESQEDDFVNFNKYQQEKLAMLKDMREQIQSTTMMDELAVLNTDISGMTKDAKAVHQLMCAKIRSKYNI